MVLWYLNVLLANAFLVFFLGCTLFFYESDGRSGIDHNSIPKHAVWVENSIVQAVPEHPKKDFVFCLSNSLGDAFLFQVRSILGLHRIVLFNFFVHLADQGEILIPLKSMAKFPWTSVGSGLRSRRVERLEFLLSSIHSLCRENNPEGA